MNKKDLSYRKTNIIPAVVIAIAIFSIIVYFFYQEKSTIIYQEVFPSSQILDISKASENHFEYSNVWWLENISLISKNQLEVRYPKWSYNPSGEPRWWAGFIHTPKIIWNTDHARLSYKVQFSYDFDFVKGWKLPGLCGGNCARGGNTQGDGFSTRFMWRKNGDLEVYGYFPEINGTSIDRGMFRFIPGHVYEIAQEVQMNTPGKSDGALKVYVNGTPVYHNSSMFYRNEDETHANSLLFSTFFGGGDASWSTPKDTSIVFSDFKISWK